MSLISLSTVTGGYEESDLSVILNKSISYYGGSGPSDEMMRAFLIGSATGGIGGGLLGIILTLVNQNI